MEYLVIVDRLEDWQLESNGLRLVTARNYLSDPEYSSIRRVKIFNLCRSYRYQSIGYYVSLLAEARGHKPMPGVSTILAMKSKAIVRYIADDLHELIQQSLSPLKAEQFELSVYFGRNMAKRYGRLATRLFNMLHSPFLRAYFVKDKKWLLQRVTPIAARDIPNKHRPFVIEAAHEYFKRRRPQARKTNKFRFDLGILIDPVEKQPPSNTKAIRKFIKAANSVGLEVELLGREDYGRLAEFDALFIRETTAVNHHTFRFARRAVAEGLVVIDDPDSILKCTNKVFLAELLQRHKIPTPKTMIAHRDNMNQIARNLGLPCILKKPDSSFSQGVLKVVDKENLCQRLKELFIDSEFVIAQSFLPTEFDWRVGILDRQPFYVCRYHMAKGHWQIINYDSKGRIREGRSEGVPLDQVPARVLKTALRAANLIGDGLYGVDLKQVGNRVYVIEVNDNPSIDGGLEDEIVKDDIYLKIMQSIVRRIEKKKFA
jgi:glutathione synthase/RimK-type ligase-like ATP-grasp enzyme